MRLSVLLDATASSGAAAATAAALPLAHAELDMAPLALGCSEWQLEGAEMTVVTDVGPGCAVKVREHAVQVVRGARWCLSPMWHMLCCEDE